MTDDSKDSKLLYCSFCNKSQHEVKKLIAGPSVFVCDECTASCIDVILYDAEADEAKDFLGMLDSNWKQFIDADDFEGIIREIEFPPEFRHAGVTILSNFSSLVQDKYKDESVKISIQQEGNKVVLIIRSEDGELKERIESVLQTYGLVISGELPIESLTDDPYKIADMKQQLRIAQMQVENQKELLEIEKRHNLQQFENHKVVESQFKDMICMMSDSMSGREQENSFLRSLITASASTQSEIANKALLTLISIVENGTQESDKPEVLKNLKKIEQNDSKAFRKITDFAESCMAGVVGNSMYSWIIPIINSMPK